MAWSFQHSVAAYIAIAILTFGISASDNQCGRHEKTAQYGRQTCIMDAGVGGFMAGLWWPLYWSWEVVEGVRK